MTCTTNISIKTESLQSYDSTHDLVDVISFSEPNSKITTNKIYSEIAKSSNSICLHCMLSVITFLSTAKMQHKDLH